MIFQSNELYLRYTFYGIKFEEIKSYYALNLSLINKFFFTETNLFIERMNIHNTPVIQVINQKIKFSMGPSQLTDTHLTVTLFINNLLIYNF
jgi:hypothetical protein